MKVFEIAGFNGKSRVIETNSDGVTKSSLYSYETHIADYDHNTNEMKVYSYHSGTTGRHINGFLEYYGFDKMTKKELFKNYNLTR